MKKLCFINETKTAQMDELASVCMENGYECEIITNKSPAFLPQFIKKALFEKKLKKEKNNNVYISFFPTQCADILFLSSITKESLKHLHAVTTVVVASAAKRYKLLNLGLVSQKVVVVYPYWVQREFDKNELGKKYLTPLNIQQQKGQKIIFFSANHLKKQGFEEYLKIIQATTNKDFLALVALHPEQISAAKFLLSKYGLSHFVYIIKLEKNHHLQMDELLFLSDIFLYPTHQHSFAPLIIRAMGYQNAVFVPKSNEASEIVDHFASMSDPADMTTVHKIEALLERNDLDYIKNLNLNTANHFTIHKTFETLKPYIDNLAL